MEEAVKGDDDPAAKSGSRLAAALLGVNGGASSRSSSPHSGGGARGGFIHPLLRRKRMSSKYIYLYIILRNHLGTLTISLLTIVGFISFLRPVPSLSSETIARNAARATLAQQQQQQQQGAGGARTGRQLTGADPATRLGRADGAGRHTGQMGQGQMGQMGQGHDRSGTLGGASEHRHGGVLSKDELLSMVKRNPDSEDVKNAVMNQRFRDNVPIYGFVHFSSYRLSPVQFAALGFSAVALRFSLRLGRCLWKEKHGGHRVTGNLTAIYPGEHHDMRYESIVLICHLEESTENDYGGILLYTVDGEDIIAYIEEKGDFPVATPRPPYKHQLAYCTPPLVGQISPRRMFEWIEYHLHMGMDRVVVYDAGAVDADLVAMLDAYKEQGISTQIVNVRQIKAYPSWDTGRLLTTNDCMYRHRFTARWVYMAEMSEYFSAESGGTLLGLLNAHEGKPYVSLGSRWWSLERCVITKESKQQSDAAQKQMQQLGTDEMGALGDGMVLGSLESSGWVWGIEKMLFHWPHFYCTNKKEFPKVELCIDYHGYRRYAVDPRMVSSAQIHRTEVPRLGGIDIDADVARLNRYPGILEESPSKECTKQMKMSEVIDWWVKDHQVELLAKEAKQQPHAQFKTHSGRGRS